MNQQQTPETNGQDTEAVRPLTSREKAEARYFTAIDGKPATEDQKAAVRTIREAVVTLAEAIYDGVPRGVCRSKALTDLNDVSMWAIRGVFDEGRSSIN